MASSDAQRPMAAALGRIPSGLFIVTARHGDQTTGMLASWIQQCSFTPPCVTVAIKQGRLLSEWLTEGARFTINLLDESQSDMLSHFGRGFAAGQPAFENVPLLPASDAGPVLAEGLAYLHCEVQKRHPAGDHDILIAHVLDGAVVNDGRPMVHIRKSGFHY